MSKRYNQSGQIIVADRFVSLSDSDSKNYIRITSNIQSSDSVQKKILKDFLDRYDFNIVGSKIINSGTTLKIRIYNENNDDVTNSFNPYEFTWYLKDGTVLAKGVNEFTFTIDMLEGNISIDLVCEWEHVIDYSIGTTSKQIKANISHSITLEVGEITEYLWNNCLTEKELEEQGYKQSGLWKETIQDNTENYLYLWVRKSNNNRLTWVYYRSTGEKGQQGIQGEQGIPGEPGANGKTSYFHIKYSSVENPTNTSQITETPSTYIGTYVDFIEEDSTDPAKYTWSRFEGIQGEQGEQGIPGIGQDGKTSYLHIAYAISADGSEGFSITDSANKTYIGQYTDFEINDSTDYTKYAWTKIKGDKGDKGDQGIQGDPGIDGQNAYTHIAYSNSEDGSLDFSTTEFFGKKYIGIYVDFEKEDSEDYTKYKWKKYVADETRIEYCWHNSEENPPEELSASYDNLDIYYDQELVWISVFDTEHSIKAPNENDIHLWIRTSIDNGKNWEYSKFNGNPAKAIKIITNRYYFDRNETNDKGEVGEYLENQIANITLERQNISGNTDVSWFFDGELYKTQSIKQQLIITPSMLNNLGKLYISVVYDNVSYDSIELYTNIIKPTYAGILPSDNTSPVTINGRECVNGDHFIYLDENGSPIARLYINGKWKDLQSTDSQYYSLVMGDILADVINKPSVNSQNGIYQFFSNIAAYGAFIKNLYTENLKINNGLFDLKIGIFNNKLVFDVLYNGNIIFSIDPYTGYIFLGKPNANKTNPETGFMINPSDENNIISTKNGYFSIDKNGILKTISMESIDSKFENAKITNGYFSGYFDCVSIKAQPDDMVLYKSATAYSSHEISSCYNVLSDLSFLGVNTSSTHAGNSYSPLYSCSVSTQSTDYASSIPILSSIKYIRVLRYLKYFADGSIDILSIEFFDANLNFISADSMEGLATASRNESELDIWNYNAAIDRIFSLRFLNSGSVKAGRWFLFDVNISIYTGGNKLVVNIPGINGAADPSSIKEKGRLYVDANGFVKAKI